MMAPTLITKVVATKLKDRRGIQGTLPASQLLIQNNMHPGIQRQDEFPATIAFMNPPMTDSAPPVRIVLTTCASPGEASRLARTLVEEHLAACATLIPAVQSIYHWEGQIEFSTETLLLLKTSTEQLAALETRLHQLHSYQTPEFLVLGVEAVSHRYLEWLQGSLGPP